MSKCDPFLTSTEIRAQKDEYHGVKISAQTVRRLLQDNSLNGRIARRKPNVSKKNFKRRLAFAKQHLHKASNFWNLVVWSDESKFNVFGNDGKPYVRRRPLKELNPRYTKKMVTHGGSSVVVWGCFTSSGVGPIIQIEGKMTGTIYKNILELNLVGDYADYLPLAWIFQRNNDPKHCSHAVKDWMSANNMKIFEWSAQSPYLN